MLTAREIVIQSKEKREAQREAQDLRWSLEEAEKDLIRNIELREREVVILERERDQKVSDYVLGGQLNVLLQFERYIEAKKDDIKRLKIILKDRFPAHGEK